MRNLRLKYLVLSLRPSSHTQLRIIPIFTVQVIPHKLPRKHLQRLGPFPSLIGQLISAMTQQDASWEFTPLTQFDPLAGNYISLGKASLINIKVNSYSEVLFV